MSAFAICCICLLLVLLIVCAFVEAKYEDEIVALKETVAKADESVRASMTRYGRQRELVMDIELANAKLRSKHEAASRRIAELIGIMEAAAEKGGE